MFYKDPDHHAVLCAQTMGAGEGWGWRGQGFFFFFLLLFFLSFPNPLPSNPSTAAHIQRLAIVPNDPLHSPNGMWVSKDFLFIPNSPMVQAGSREEVRSQLPGDSGWEWSGCDLFSIQQSQSKASVGWEADRRISPTPNLIKGCFLLSSRRGSGLVVPEGEGRRSMRGGGRMRWSEIFSPFQLSSFRFSPTHVIILGFCGCILTPL